MPAVYPVIPDKISDENRELAREQTATPPSIVRKC
jgi:hypothetical protein